MFNHKTFSIENSLTQTYYPGIHFLRGLAAFMVCFFHFTHYHDFRTNLFAESTWIYQWGELCVNGVFVFFVISGFVIPLALFKENYRPQYFGRFMLRRLLRIEIPYVLSISLVLLVSFLFAVKNNSHFVLEPGRLAHHLFYTIPFSKYQWYNVIYWTLAIEFQLYIFLGMFYFLFSTSSKWLAFMSVLVFALSNFVFTDNRFIFNYAAIFAQGFTLFLFKTKRANVTQTILLLSICIGSTAYLHSLSIALFGAFAVVCILWLHLNQTWTNRFGHISYSLYLVHGLSGGLLIYFFAPYFQSNTARYVLLAMACIVSLLSAFVYWWLVERPAQNWSKKIGMQEKNMQQII